MKFVDHIYDGMADFTGMACDKRANTRLSAELGKSGQVEILTERRFSIDQGTRLGAPGLRAQGSGLKAKGSGPRAQGSIEFHWDADVSCFLKPKI